MFGMKFFSRTRKELVSNVPESSGYRYPFHHGATLHFGERPPFTVLTAELMEFDPKVSIGLAARDGLISASEVEVKEGPPEILEFVAAQWTRIWSREKRLILEAKKFGYAGFEAMFRDAGKSSRWAGKILFDRLRDFHPRDVRPLVRGSDLVGLTVRNVRDGRANGDRIKGLHPAADTQAGGRRAIWAPKCLWVTFGQRYGNLYGQSLLERAYPSWHEKTMHGGAIKLRQLRMIKDAWVGDIVYYPNETLTMPDGVTKVSWRDIVREMNERRMSGGIIGLPMKRDQFGNKNVEYQPPTNVSGATQIFEYGDVLDGEILESLQTPGEVLEALSSGSGFSGRSVPLMVLLAILQIEFEDYLRQIDEQIIRQLVRINFGVEPEYEITARSLIDVITEKLGGSQIGGESMGSPGADPSQRNPTMPASPMMSRFRSQMMQGGSEQFSSGLDSYRRSQVCAHVVHSHARLIGAASFVAPNGGSIVGGIFYPGGRLVPAEAVQFASDDELRALPIRRDREVEAVGGRPVLFSGDRRSLMARLSVQRFEPIRLSEDSGLRWITIGAKDTPEGRKGGFPVQIDGKGNIVGGKRAEKLGLHGLHLGDVKEHFDERRAIESGGDGGSDDFDFSFDDDTKTARKEAEKQLPGKKTQLRARLVEAAGDDERDQASVYERMKAVLEAKADEVRTFNDQLEQIHGSRTSDRRLSLIGKLRKRSDPSKVEGFDELLDEARRYYPALLNHPEAGGDEEWSLAESIRGGKLRTPSIMDDEILDEALRGWYPPSEYVPVGGDAELDAVQFATN